MKSQRYDQIERARKLSVKLRRATWKPYHKRKPV